MSGRRRCRWSRQALVSTAHTPSPNASSRTRAQSVMRVGTPRARAMVASRSPTPTTGSSTPSERAPGRIASPATSTLTTAEASSSGPAPPGPEMGRTRHAQGAHRAAVAQPAGSAGPSSRRSRVLRQGRWCHVDVAEWRRHRHTKPEDAGSTPAVDADLAVAQRRRAPRSERGGRTFESCRRGQPCRDGPVVKTPGPQLGDRGSTPRRGTPCQVVQRQRRPAVTRKVKVRVLP